MLSIIVPTFNEEESLRQLHSEVDTVCQTNDLAFEIVFVDDGSTDGSWTRSRNWHARMTEFRPSFPPQLWQSRSAHGGDGGRTGRSRHDDGRRLAGRSRRDPELPGEI